MRARTGQAGLAHPKSHHPSTLTALVSLLAALPLLDLVPCLGLPGEAEKSRPPGPPRVACAQNSEQPCPPCQVSLAGQDPLQHERGPHQAAVCGKGGVSRGLLSGIRRWRGVVSATMTATPDLARGPRNLFALVAPQQRGFLRRRRRQGPTTKDGFPNALQGRSLGAGSADTLPWTEAFSATASGQAPLRSVLSTSAEPGGSASLLRSRLKWSLTSASVRGS